jgi:hypothetical protein
VSHQFRPRRVQNDGRTPDDLGVHDIPQVVVGVIREEDGEYKIGLRFVRDTKAYTLIMHPDDAEQLIYMLTAATSAIATGEV